MITQIGAGIVLAVLASCGGAPHEPPATPNAVTVDARSCDSARDHVASVYFDEAQPAPAFTRDACLERATPALLTCLLEAATIDTVLACERDATPDATAETRTLKASIGEDVGGTEAYQIVGIGDGLHGELGGALGCQGADCEDGTEGTADGTTDAPQPARDTPPCVTGDPAPAPMCQKPPCDGVTDQ